MLRTNGQEQKRPSAMTPEAKTRTEETETFILMGDLEEGELKERKWYTTMKERVGGMKKKIKE